MSRWHSYVISASEILSRYKGEEPFPSFIKKYFAGHRKFGSTDRKQVSHLCYCYFRLGKSLPDLDINERILTGLFLCSDQPNRLLGELKPGWNDSISLSLAEKANILGHSGLDKEIFPWWDELGDGVNKQAFSFSHLKQPDLFLRLRPGKENTVKQKLEKAGIAYTILDTDCLSLPNATRIDQLVGLDKEAVVQDLGSQRVGALFSRTHFKGIPKVWDCCAASGGKSIMAADKLGNIELTVSDARESILVNLRQRFANAGLRDYSSFSADLTKPLPAVRNDFDLVIADVPCTGSGTWSRNPEQLFYFQEKKIAEYALLQQEIVNNVVPHIKAGGYLLYVTCSVFKKENEDNIALLRNAFELELIQVEMTGGYTMKADTLFAALLQRSPG